jgi:hypothetical protein
MAEPRCKRTAPLAALAGSAAARQAEWTAAWHRRRAGPSASGLLALVRGLHRRNFDLWHTEDQARAPRAPDSRIAAVKRRIDRLNQQRNDLIESFDAALAGKLEVRRRAPPAAPWNTETPGACLDRLSILALKIYHMREQAERRDASPEHRARCAARRALLEQQRADLLAAFQQLLRDLAAGRKQLRLYRQFKMYNDPALNPAIYRRVGKGK